MEAYGMWELGVWGVFLSPAVVFLLSDASFPLLFYPCLTWPRALLSRPAPYLRVGWFAPSIMVLHCFLGWAMGYLGRCVCWVDSYAFACWVWAQGGTSLLGTSGFF